MDQVTQPTQVQNPPQQNPSSVNQVPQMQKSQPEGFLFLIIVIAGIYGVSRLMQSENKWVCVDGEWVKEGNPEGPKPTTTCDDGNGTDETPANGELDLDKPLPEGPAGELETYELGALKISTYNPVTITALETSTNLYFEVENTENEKVTLTYIPLTQDSNEEGVFQHLFWLFDESVSILGSQKKTLEFVAAPSQGGGGSVPFTFETSNNEEITIELKVNTAQFVSFNELPKTAVITGKVYDAIGAPIDQAEVELSFYNAYERITEKTDQSGEYTFTIPSVDDIEAALGDRTRPYDTYGYYLNVTKDGYELRYVDDISPNRAETETIDFNLDPFVDDIEYSLIGSHEASEVFGYWWLMPVNNFNLLTAVQGRHPPELNKEGYILAVDNKGNEQWRIETNDECWGFDVSPAGLIAAACHDGTVYVVNSTGSILWQKDVGGQAREIEFSNAGDKVIVGPYRAGNNQSDFALLESEDGSIIWSGPNNDEWLRNSRFSSDDQRIVFGMSGGRLLSYTIQGDKIYERFIGEFPMVLEIDDTYNIYAAGKNRELFSYDLLGALRWRKAIPNHVVTAGSDNMSDDGKIIVMGTVGAHVYAFNPDGEILWQQHIKGELQGHNALDVTPDGNYIAVGSAGTQDGGWLQVFHKSGNLLWEKQFEDLRDPDKLDYTYDHNQSGAITVAISDDAEYVAAGYGDSTIRIFKQE